MCLLPDSVIVLFVTMETIEGEEEEEMNHYMDFDPNLIRERNQQMQREVRSLRLEERLREERGSSGSRFTTLAKRSVRPLLRAVRLVG